MANKNSIERQFLILCYKGSTRQLAKFLKDNKDLLDINIRDKSNNSGLHYVVFNRRIGSCKLLLDQEGINVNVRSATGYTPLTLACSLKPACIEIIRMLLEKSRKDIFECDETTEILNKVVIADQPNVLKLFLEFGLDKEKELPDIHLNAASLNKTAIVNYLLEQHQCQLFSRFNYTLINSLRNQPVYDDTNVAQFSSTCIEFLTAIINYVFVYEPDNIFNMFRMVYHARLNMFKDKFTFFMNNIYMRGQSNSTLTLIERLLELPIYKNYNDKFILIFHLHDLADERLSTIYKDRDYDSFFTCDVWGILLYKVFCENEQLFHELVNYCMKYEQFGKDYRHLFSYENFEDIEPATIYKYFLAANTHERLTLNAYFEVCAFMYFLRYTEDSKKHENVMLSMVPFVTSACPFVVPKNLIELNFCLYRDYTNYTLGGHKFEGFPIDNSIEPNTLFNLCRIKIRAIMFKANKNSKDTLSLFEKLDMPSFMVNELLFKEF